MFLLVSKLFFSIPCPWAIQFELTLDISFIVLDYNPKVVRLAFSLL